MEKRPDENLSPVTIPLSVLKKIKGDNGVTEEDYELLENLRPRTRADCEGKERPCPFAGCQYHLYLDVNGTSGSIRINFPGKEIWEIPVTCVLDVAEEGGLVLDEIGKILNLTRERVRQIEADGLVKVLREISKDKKDKDEIILKLLTDYTAKKARRIEQIKALNNKRRREEGHETYIAQKERKKMALKVMSAIS